MTGALETTGLAKRYGRTWALRDCTLAVPAGRVAAVVGPNGAGKTTLMRLAVGLRRPTKGSVAVFGRRAARRRGVARPDRVRRAGDARSTATCRSRSTWRWDGGSTAMRGTGRRPPIGSGSSSIPLDRRAGELSGGQRAQVALSIALAKRPDLLVLDEPVASLDPLARRTFLSELMGEVATRELTVLLSSHLIADLEHRCDYLVSCRTRACRCSATSTTCSRPTRVLVGPASDAPAPAGIGRVLRARHRSPARRSSSDRTPTPRDRRCGSHEPVSLEDLVLAYLSEPDGRHAPGPGRVAVIWLTWRRRRGAVVATGSRSSRRPHCCSSRVAPCGARSTTGDWRRASTASAAPASCRRPKGLPGRGRGVRVAVLPDAAARARAVHVRPARAGHVLGRPGRRPRARARHGLARLDPERLSPALDVDPARRSGRSSGSGWACSRARHAGGTGPQRRDRRPLPVADLRPAGSRARRLRAVCGPLAASWEPRRAGRRARWR